MIVESKILRYEFRREPPSLSSEGMCMCNLPGDNLRKVRPRRQAEESETPLKTSKRSECPPSFFSSWFRVSVR